MIKKAIPLSFLLAFFVFPAIGHAHRVNVFAYVQANDIVVECSFAKNKPVLHGVVKFYDARENVLLAEKNTDGNGKASMTPDEQFLEKKHGVKIELNAGEGHKSEWIMGAEDLAPLYGKGIPQEMQVPPLEKKQPVENTMPVGWEEAMDKLLEQKIAPLRAMIAKSRNAGPNLRDIIGGLGWILGLLGMATYFRYRPKK